MEIDHALKHLATAVDGANRDACIGFVGEEVQGRAITGNDYELCCDAVHSLPYQAGYIYGTASAETIKIGDRNGKTNSVFTDTS